MKNITKIMGILLTMDDNTRKKTNAKSLLKSILKVFKKDSKKEKELETEKKDVKTKDVKANVTASVISPAARFRLKCETIEREDEEGNNEKEIALEEIEDVEEDRKNERLQPQRSRDSGFIEKEEESVENGVTNIFSKLTINGKDNKKPVTAKNEKGKETCDDVIESLKDLKLGEKKEKKEKKVVTVTISRAPVDKKNCGARNQAHPYTKQSSQHVTINKQTFSGGQVIEGDMKVVDTALQNLWSSSIRRRNEFNKDEDLDIITALINKPGENANQNKTKHLYQNNATYSQEAYGQYDNVINAYNEAEVDNILDEFGISQPVSQVIQTSGHNLQPVPEDIQTISNNFPVDPNDGIQQLLTRDYHLSEECRQPDLLTWPDEFTSFIEGPAVYPTPPRSVGIGSPLSDFQLSPRAHTSSSDYTFSPPDRSSPFLNLDMERRQDIPQLEPNQFPETILEKKKCLKDFKHMQKSISASFCDNECCQKNRKSSLEIFDERWKKFSPEERKNICVNVSKMDIKAAYWVLENILRSISNGSDKEDLEYSIFRHICGRVLGEYPDWFLGKFGVTLLELAVFRCHGHPALTRYLVECIRTVKRPDGLDVKDCLLPLRVDSKRDNLVLACARGGDSFGDVLYWLVAREPHQPPLFDLGHVNAEGYSALHVACKMHSAASPRIHIAHVLLQHGRVDLWQGDHKGGDTALHFAVNSPTCDLQLVLMIFSQVEQKQWKQLATWNNLGSVTPIEYARCAVKSKPCFPVEVLEFMRKLRT